MELAALPPRPLEIPLARPYLVPMPDAAPPLPLRDKTFVIVGGTTGLGLSAAKACAAAGARLVIVGRDADTTASAAAELQALNGNVPAAPPPLALTADATDPATAPAAIAAAVERFGPLHGLYHVAGGSGRRFGDGPLHEITDQGWRATLDLNLASAFYSNRAAARQFLAQGTGGSVLNMGSVLGFSPSPAHFSTHAYAAAKAARGRPDAIRRRLLRAARHPLQRAGPRPGGNADVRPSRRRPNDPPIHRAPSSPSTAGGSAGRPTSTPPWFSSSPTPPASSPGKCWPSTAGGA